jgi:hypothetical protein
MRVFIVYKLLSRVCGKKFVGGARSQETGDRSQETGDRRQETGDSFCVFSPLATCHLPLSSQESVRIAAIYIS